MQAQQLVAVTMTTECQSDNVYIVTPCHVFLCRQNIHNPHVLMNQETKIKTYNMENEPLV